MENQATWYIVKTAEGYCQIFENTADSSLKAEKSWGPFTSYEDAIARRVGLIRAGKCQPQ
ncbi:MAG: hypothetical protein VKJ02_08265 [Snowella sp.]|nr:hypothetical protein [Snowella sp.]